MLFGRWSWEPPRHGVDLVDDPVGRASRQMVDAEDVPVDVAEDPGGGLVRLTVEALSCRLDHEGATHAVVAGGHNSTVRLCGQ